ncbi:hypothetical protein B0H14DRAFT_3489180 [Mycena olivaceomarginata]|nr:hypothetical protein B0H14DRAFT_3489180 [Mycena olivaceomarginata]
MSKKTPLDLRKRCPRCLSGPPRLQGHRSRKCSECKLPVKVGLAGQHNYDRIVHRVLMLDEIAVEKRARWDNKTNMILGACREHSEKAGLPIGNSPDVVARKAAEVECICGKEVTNDQRESDAVKCIRAGCETIWFHIDCAAAEEWRRNGLTLSSSNCLGRRGRTPQRIGDPAWGEATFKAAGRVAKEPHLITDQISTIIRARGSQKRGKMVKAYRASRAPRFRFRAQHGDQRIEADRRNVVALLEGAAFHYKASVYIHFFSDVAHELSKDPKTRTGYGGNKIITARASSNNFQSQGLFWCSFS